MQTTDTLHTNHLIEYRDRKHTYWPVNVVAFSATIFSASMLNDWPSTKLSDVVVWMLAAGTYVVQAFLEMLLTGEDKTYLAMYRKDKVYVLLK